jgi:hypothetical protein
MRVLRGRYGYAHRGERKFCPAGSRVQALLFPTSRFTVAQAKAWATRHDWRSNDVDVKPEFIHLRQESPSVFKRIRTKYLGGRGVQAHVGWEKC